MSRDAALFAIAPIYFIKVPVVGGSRVVVGGKVVVPKIEKTFSFSYPTVADHLLPIPRLRARQSPGIVVVLKKGK